MNYFFTADEHYGHQNIIKYCNRPFKSVSEMDKVLIDNHNRVVTKDDIVIHAGDFTFKSHGGFVKYFTQLDGNHVFLRGSHDGWMDSKYHEIWEAQIKGQNIVVCHYAMRRWARSHYGSWNLHGHSHGKLESEGKQYDIGVDNNNFYPVLFDDIAKIMKTKPDNLDIINPKARGWGEGNDNN